MSDKRECKLASCRHFGGDPDGNYCNHIKGFEITRFGLSTNEMSVKGLCTHGDNGEYQLWESKE